MSTHTSKTELREHILRELELGGRDAGEWAFGVDGRTATGILRTLEKEGLVYRRTELVCSMKGGRPSRLRDKRVVMWRLR